MDTSYFLSYSRVDAGDVALRIADELGAGSPCYRVWLDVRDIHAGPEDWDRQLVEAIKLCNALLFVMTKDSVRDQSGCKPEWAAGLRYKKTVIPVRLHDDAELPFRLSSRQFIDFSDSFDAGLARLREHLEWVDSPAGLLQDLRARRADGEYELARAYGGQRRRIEDELEELLRRIEEQERIVEAPRSVVERTEARIGEGIELERQPARAVGGEQRARVVNPPPMAAPAYFQDRYVETQVVGAFLRDPGLRVMTVVGRGGAGKTAMVCRLLKALEQGRLPEDLGDLTLAGIVYLSPLGAHPVSFPNLFTDLCRLLPGDRTGPLLARYRNGKATPVELMRMLLEEFPEGNTVVLLLDNFEDLMDGATYELTDPSLDAALRALLSAPVHGVKVIITTRVPARKLLLAHPAVQRRLDLDEGLPSPFAEEVLRGSDPDGRLGLRDAPDELLARAREQTRGLPRALEALVAILAADRDSTLAALLADAALTPENVVEAIVGEAFSRLDRATQGVLQALAIYPSAVPPVAVDYLLQPFEPAVDSAPLLSRLVDMGFVRGDRGRYHLHHVDRNYALSRVPVSEAGNGGAHPPEFTQTALSSRAADYFREVRTPPATWRGLDDVWPQLAEFELRCLAGDFDGAGKVLAEIDQNYLMVWGHYALVAELYERLPGCLENPRDDAYRKSILADCYDKLGETHRAIKLYEEALAINRGLPRARGLQRVRRARRRVDIDLLNEAASMSNLGGCYLALGDIHRAIRLYEQAVRMHYRWGLPFNEATSLNCLGSAYTEVGNFKNAIKFHERALEMAETGHAKTLGRADAERIIEGASWRGLGVCYARQGNTGAAIELQERALAIARDIGHQDQEAEALMFLGDCHADLADWPRAARYCEQAIATADQIGVVDTRAGARVRLAEIQLQADDLNAAVETLQILSTAPDPSTDQALTLGLVLARGNDPAAAGQAFTDAACHAAELVHQASDNYHALDVQALALCGIAVAGDPERLPEASVWFRSARQVTRADGVVRRVLRLLDALSPADPEGILMPIRRTAAGQDR